MPPPLKLLNTTILHWSVLVHLLYTNYLLGHLHSLGQWAVLLTDHVLLRQRTLVRTQQHHTFGHKYCLCRVYGCINSSVRRQWHQVAWIQFDKTGTWQTPWGWVQFFGPTQVSFSGVLGPSEPNDLYPTTFLPRKCVKTNCGKWNWHKHFTVIFTDLFTSVVANVRLVLCFPSPE